MVIDNHLNPKHVIMVRQRRHHNNKGLGQVKRGRTYEQVRHMCKRLGLPFNHKIEEVSNCPAGQAVSQGDKST